MPARTLQLATTTIYGINVPIVNVATYVCPQVAGYFTAHGPVTEHDGLRYHPTIIDVFETDTVEQFVISGDAEYLDPVGEGQDFFDFATPQNWKHWTGSGFTIVPGVGVVPFDKLPIELPTPQVTLPSVAVPWIIGNIRITGDATPVLPHGIPGPIEQINQLLDDNKIKVKT